MIANASLRRVSSIVCRRICSRSVDRQARELALPRRRSRTRRRGRAPWPRPGTAPSRSSAARNRPKPGCAAAVWAMARPGRRGRPSSAVSCRARFISVIQTSQPRPRCSRISLALRLFGRAQSVQLVMVAQFLAVHAGTAVPSSSRRFLQRGAHPGLDRAQRLAHLFGHLGLRESFEIRELDHLALVGARASPSPTFTRRA